MPAGEKADRGDECHVVQEAAGVAAASVEHHAADTFGDGQQPEDDEDQTQPPTDRQGDDEAADDDVRQRGPGVDVLIEEPRVAYLAVGGPRPRDAITRCSLRSSQRMAK